jgi:hypothetical protein
VRITELKKQARQARHLRRKLRRADRKFSRRFMSQRRAFDGRTATDSARVAFLVDMLAARGAVVYNADGVIEVWDAPSWIVRVRHAFRYLFSAKTAPTVVRA